MKSRSHIREPHPRARRAVRTWRHAWGAAILAVSFHGLIAAEGPVSAVQDALKRHQFYSGEPSGVLDDGTRAALRRFQTQVGLRPTGEIDSATMEKLQGEIPVARPTLEAAPVATKSRPADPIVQKDRHFLQKVETGLEPIPPKARTPAVVETAPPPSEAPAPEAVAAAPVPEAREPITENGRARPAVSKSASAKNRPAEAPRKVAPRKISKSKPPTAPREVSEREDDPDPLGSHGTRIIRSTRTSGPGGRTIIYEKKTTTVVGTPIPIRRAEPVKVQRREGGFFDRIFGEHENLEPPRR